MGPFRVSAILLCVALVSLISRSTVEGVGKTSVAASAPVNPVESGGIFSLRCEVFKMKQNQEMTIFRNVKGATERLSVDEEVLDGAGDRVFLAVRQMTDGSVVYLLSIMAVSKDDEGFYMCKIFDMDEQNWVSEDSLTLQVMYVPESEPLCAPVESYSVMEGSTVNLNCSSELAFPGVHLEWSRTGDLSIPKPTTITNWDRVYSTFAFTPTLKDDTVVFLCEVSSPAFPDFVQTCHVGPFSIIRNPNFVHEVITDTPSSDITSNRIANEDQNIRPKPGNNQNKPESDLSTECRSACSAYRYPILYWIIGTIVACFLAMVFLIMGIILVVKYRRLNVQPRPTYYLSQHPVDDIYTELECRRGDSTVYMSLGKTATSQKGQVLEAIADDHDKQYDIKQSS